MLDPAIAVINNQRTENITYQWFRNNFREDLGIKESLNYGHAVIDSVPKLNQYLHTYGPMIESQWQEVSSHLDSIDPAGRVIDYGCGQGFAGLLMNDLTGDALLSNVGEIVLIEPSALALARAEAIYRRIAPQAEVTSVCKLFDEVEKDDLPAGSPASTLHVFSNSLDVDGFDALRLLHTTLTPGSHTLLSISHDRDFNGGTPKVLHVKQAVEAACVPPDARIVRSLLEYFTCNNPSQSKGVMWLCEMEIDDD